MRVEFKWEYGVNDDQSLCRCIEELHKYVPPVPEHMRSKPFAYVARHMDSLQVASVLCTLTMEPEQDECALCKVILEVANRPRHEIHGEIAFLSKTILSAGGEVMEAQRIALAADDVQSIQAVENAMKEFGLGRYRGKHLKPNF